jgi:SAM-dependent methyltransferase
MTLPSLAFPAAATSLSNNGERMVPEESDPTTFWEHIHRYQFASRLVADAEVLDVACGEGYGSHALCLAGAASVTGVDVSPGACLHAARKYNVRTVAGSAEMLPIATGSIDVIVSFETVEHVPHPRAFVQECRRVLRPDGVLVISTPNKDAYTAHCPDNPFHCSEMGKSDFTAMLSGEFRHLRLYTQTPVRAGWWVCRSLAALESPWKQVKGYWWLTQRLFDDNWDDVAASDRLDVQKAIRKVASANRHWTNPFVVRQYASYACEQPRYFVAVCRP